MGETQAGSGTSWRAGAGHRARALDVAMRVKDIVSPTLDKSHPKRAAYDVRFSSTSLLARANSREAASLYMSTDMVARRAESRRAATTTGPFQRGWTTSGRSPRRVLAASVMPYVQLLHLLLASRSTDRGPAVLAQTYEPPSFVLKALEPISRRFPAECSKRVFNLNLTPNAGCTSRLCCGSCTGHLRRGLTCHANAVHKPHRRQRDLQQVQRDSQAQQTSGRNWRRHCTRSRRAREARSESRRDCTALSRVHLRVRQR